MNSTTHHLTPFGLRALITGSDRGIGLGVARALAAAGCAVILNFHDEGARGRAEASRLREEHGVEAHALGADIGEPASARGLVRQAAELLGGLDIVISNAGICQFQPILELSDEGWARHLATNLSGGFYVAQEAAKILVAQGTGGRIVFTTSVGAERSNTGQTHYCATKGGLHLLMQGLALELGPHGITVNAVAPGWIHTEINDEASRDPAVTKEWLKAHCPVGRLGQVEDISSAYLFLASREAAYVNGASITVDGGWNAQL